MEPMSLAERIDVAARWLGSARRTVVLTGAGVSTESGIPDFRSASGLWARYNPAEYATLGAFRSDPVKVWRMLAELEQLLLAEPNPAHWALAELEQSGHVAGIVTQNVDGLHQAGGSRNVVEYHGSNRTLSCLACGAVYAREALQGAARPPRCRTVVGGAVCGAVLKPDVVFFDEMIPPQALIESERLLEGADLILVVGTSCEVYPAAEIPFRVRRQGGKIVEINLEPAEGLPSDLVFAERCSAVLPALSERVKALGA
jgi:NAD-dependent deacetylase